MFVNAITTTNIPKVFVIFGINDPTPGGGVPPPPPLQSGDSNLVGISSANKWDFATTHHEITATAIGGSGRIHWYANNLMSIQGVSAVPEVVFTGAAAGKQTDVPIYIYPYVEFVGTAGDVQCRGFSVEII
jgi:hypothetical protein